MFHVEHARFELCAEAGSEMFHVEHGRDPNPVTEIAGSGGSSGASMRSAARPAAFHVEHSKRPLDQPSHSRRARRPRADLLRAQFRLFHVEHPPNELN